MYDALILAARDGFDVFNALDILDNAEVFSVKIICALDP